MVPTEHTPRRQQFHVPPAMQQPNNTVSTTLLLIFFKKRYKKKKRKKKGCCNSMRIARDMSAASMLENRAERYIKSINNNNVKRSV